MKKALALTLSLLMIVASFAGCGKNGDLVNAKDYLIGMYQTGSADEAMVIGADKDVLSVVTVDGNSYDVEWSISITQGAADSVKIAESSTANCVKIDVPELSTEEILFTAIATVKDKKHSESAEFLFKVNAVLMDDGSSEGGNAVADIINEAFGLAEGAAMANPVALTGKVLSVDTAYSDQYKNVTVTIVVEGFEDKAIKCYRLAGDGADTLAVGDIVTVNGTIKNYMGTIEFDQGCTIVSIVKGDGTAPTNPDGTVPTAPVVNNNSGSGNSGNSGSSNSGSSNSGSSNSGSSNSGSSNSGGALKLVTDQAKILADAFALGKNETTPYIAKLTGKVISIDKEYNAQYGSVSVLINVGEKNILCWNMKGTGTDKVKPGDTITVTGVIKNFYYEETDTSGKVEFTYDAASGTEVNMIELIPTTEVAKDLSIVANPQVGVAYKFGFFSTAKNATYYAVGGMSGYYMATSTSAAAAIDVYLENATGGYYLYAMIGGKKQYMNMEVSGTHLNAVYRDTPSTVYTYDTTKQTLVTNIDRGADKGVKEQAFGTYDNYVTIGTTYTDKDSYFCHFYA